MEAYDRLVKDKEASTITGMCRRTRKAMEEKGTFPQRRRLSERISGYSYNELMLWLKDRFENAPVSTAVGSNDNKSMIN